MSVLGTRFLRPKRSPHKEEGRNSEGESRKNVRRMTMAASITVVTEGQKKQLKRIVEDGVDRAFEVGGFDKERTQRIIEQGDELQSRVFGIMNELSQRNQFADEEVESSYGYLSGYTKPKGMTKQTNILRRLISGIGFADEKLA